MIGPPGRVRLRLPGDERERRLDVERPAGLRRRLRRAGRLQVGARLLPYGFAVAPQIERQDVPAAREEEVHVLVPHAAVGALIVDQQQRDRSVGARLPVRSAELQASSVKNVTGRMREPP